MPVIAVLRNRSHDYHYKIYKNLRIRGLPNRWESSCGYTPLRHNARTTSKCPKLSETATVRQDCACSNSFMSSILDRTIRTYTSAAVCYTPKQHRDVYLGLFYLFRDLWKRRWDMASARSLAANFKSYYTLSAGFGVYIKHVVNQWIHHTTSSILQPPYTCTFDLQYFIPRKFYNLLQPKRPWITQKLKSW